MSAAIYAQGIGADGSSQMVDSDDANRELYDDFTTIDWVRDRMRDHQLDKLEKHPALNTAYSWLLYLLTGLSIGFAASWIDVSAAWMGYCSIDWYLSKRICCSVQDIPDCDEWWDWSFVLFNHRNISFVNCICYVSLSICCAAACATLVCNLSPYASGSGTAEVKTILGGFIIKGFLSARTLVPLAVASGLAVGKEGPMIHVACCFGNSVSSLFGRYDRNEARKREVLSASAAAGVAVAFGAPIGGVLFSLEELSTFFPTKTMIRSFFCALVACVTLQFVDPYRGHRVMYQVTYSRDWHFFELVFFVIIGIFGGLSGAFLIRMNLKVQNLRKRYSWIKTWPYTLYEVAAITLVTALICYMNIYTRVDSSELLEHLFRECAESNFGGLCDGEHIASTVASLIFALILRMGLTTITIGVQVPSGIFIPSMVWGALFGRILGICVESFQMSYPSMLLFSSCHPDKACVTPGMYALLGAISALGGVTRMTVSLTVVMFELTGTLNYIIPCMVCLIVSKVVGDAAGGSGGMAEVIIRTNKYPFLDPRDDEDLFSMAGVTRAEEVMTPISSLICFHSNGMTVRDIDRILKETSNRGFPVLLSASDANIVGYISRTDLKYALGKHIEQIDGSGLDKAIDHEMEMNSSIYFDRDQASDSVISTPVLNRRRSSHLNAFSPSSSLNLTVYMDKTPISVHPKISVDLVMDIFKKLGPRKIIVKHMGLLKGIITKKDLLSVMYRGQEPVAFPHSPRSSIITGANNDGYQLQELDRRD